MTQNIVYVEIALFNSIMILIVLQRVVEERNTFRDCRLFSMVLGATFLANIMDAAGWMLDGQLLGDLRIVTNLIDGFNLLASALTCWCWVQYVQYLAYDDAGISGKKNHFSTILFALQTALILIAIPTDLLYYIDESGIYIRSFGMEADFALSLLQLLYSIGIALYMQRKAKSAEKRNELLLVSVVILLPLSGAVVQGLCYGMPLIWSCMTVATLIVYVHIQDKRRNLEKAEQQEKLQQALTQAQAASEAKSTFMTRMSHDLRTPLNGILGLTSLALDEVDASAEVIADLKKIRSSGDYLLGLVNDILDMSLIENDTLELKQEPYDYESFLLNLKSMFEPLCRQKNIRFEVVSKQQKVTILTDKVRLNQIFFNILSNAVKYTPEGGFVSYREENCSFADNKVCFDCVIQDTGMGMSEDFQTHMFEAFSRESTAITTDLQGCGLGLSIAKSLVDMMGGSLSIQSRQGIGTTVTIHLCFTCAKPIAASQSAAALPADQNSALAGKRALLAEDHPINAEIATRLLEKQKMEVILAENGAVAVEKFAASAIDYFDVILMDIRMPVMDGLAATEAIRRLNRPDAKHVPILAMTANAFKEDVQLSYAAGMNAHLAKPIDPQLLYRSIMQYCQQREGG